MELSAAQRAFGIKDITLLIIETLVVLTVSESPSSSSTSSSSNSQHASLPSYYRELCSTSLVSPQFYTVSQQILQGSLAFVNGTPQLLKWLSSIEHQPEEDRMENSRVFLTDPLPFKQGKMEDGFKWDFEIVGKVLGKLKGCKELFLGFMAQEVLPAEWLTTENLKDLRVLQLGSPLALTETPSVSESSSSTPPVKPAFKALSHFAPVANFPKISRDWKSTFLFLSSGSVALYHLNLSHFPLFTQYLIPYLFSFAPSIEEFSLPHFELETSTGSLFTYAQACTSLKRLYIGRVTPQSISALCLLLIFPPSLEKIKIEYIEGSLGGHYDWSPKGQQQDTYLQLIDILEKMLKSHDLRSVHFGKAKWLLPEHQRSFQELMEKRNCNGIKMKVSVGEMDNERTKEEVIEFSQIVQASLQTILKAQEMLGEPVDKDIAELLESPIPANGEEQVSFTVTVDNEEEENASKICEVEDESITAVAVDGEKMKNGVTEVEEKKESWIVPVNDDSANGKLSGESGEKEKEKVGIDSVEEEKEGVKA